jgi:hypothetical protein
VLGFDIIFSTLSLFKKVLPRFFEDISVNYNMEAFKQFLNSNPGYICGRIIVRESKHHTIELVVDGINVMTKDKVAYATEHKIPIYAEEAKKSRCIVETKINNLASTVKELLDLLIDCKEDVCVEVLLDCVEYSEWKDIQRVSFYAKEMIIKDEILCSHYFDVRVFTNENDELLTDIVLVIGDSDESRFSFPKKLLNNFDSIRIKCNDVLTERFDIDLGRHRESVTSITGEGIYLIKLI